VSVPHPGEVCPVCRVTGPPPFRFSMLISWLLAHRLMRLPINHG
jgi:hypothetical protein